MRYLLLALLLFPSLSYAGTISPTTNLAPFVEFEPICGVGETSYRVVINGGAVGNNDCGTGPISLDDGYLGAPNYAVRFYDDAEADLSAYVSEVFFNFSEEQIEYSRTPSGSSFPQQTITIDVDLKNYYSAFGMVDDEWWCVEIYNGTTNEDLHNDPVPMSETSHTFTFTNPPTGNYLAVAGFTSATEECSNASANQGWLDFEYEGEATVFEVTTPVVGGGGFMGMVGIGDTVMTQTTGQNMSANVAYAGNTFYKPFMGGGLAFLYAMRYWIVALIIISCIAYFAYRKAYGSH